MIPRLVDSMSRCAQNTQHCILRIVHSLPIFSSDWNESQTQTLKPLGLDGATVNQQDFVSDIHIAVIEFPLLVFPHIMKIKFSRFVAAGCMGIGRLLRK